MNKFVVIADDFTGANDTGVQFRQNGASVNVLFTIESNLAEKSDVLVINTESRADTIADSQKKIRQTITHHPATYYYKKIDSTLRGNIGAEIETALLASQKRLAIVAPAVPQAGRIIKNGLCYVNHTLLTETEFASDPKTPIISSELSTVLRQQTALPIHHFTFEQIRSGAFLEQLRQLENTAPAIVTFDSETDDDLAQIAQSLLSHIQSYLLVGAAGLANALPKQLYCSAPSSKPVLIVAGSMSEATRKQIKHAADNKPSLKIIDIDVQTLLMNQANSTDELEKLTQHALTILEQGQHCLIRTARHENERHHIEQFCLEQGWNRKALGEKLSQLLGQLTKNILSQQQIGALFLTGGDIASAIALALNAKGYRIHAEVVPCIPYGTFINSDIKDTPVITKAGGFGHDTALLDALHFIEEKFCDT